MSFEFKLPELGENIATATIVGVLVSVGDQIKPGQAVLELETDKAVLEVPSDVGGTVTAVHVKSGQEIGIGQLLLTLEEAGAAEAAATSQAAPAQPAAPAAPAAETPVVAASAAPSPEEERLKSLLRKSRHSEEPVYESGAIQRR